MIEAAKLKRMGVLPGFSDFIIIYPYANVLFVEMKYGRGRLSDHQAAFAEKVRDIGFEYLIVNSFDEFKNEIEKRISI